MEQLGMAKAKKLWDIQIRVDLQVWATDDLKAQNLVLSLMENHLADMTDCPQIEEARIAMGPDNPKTVGRVK